MLCPHKYIYHSILSYITKRPKEARGVSTPTGESKSPMGTGGHCSPVSVLSAQEQRTFVNSSYSGVHTYIHAYIHKYTVHGS